MTCRNVQTDVKTGTLTSVPLNKDWGRPAYCPIGIRHEGGVTLIQALVRNVGTCRPDVKGEVQMNDLHEDASTDAGHRGGVTCIRDEGSVMGPDRRGNVVQLYSEDNPQGEDLIG